MGAYAGRYLGDAIFPHREFVIEDGTEMTIYFYNIYIDMET